MIESADFRTAMARLGAAVNLVTTDGPAGRHGITASAVCSVTDTPPTLLVCVNRASRANVLLKANGVLCVNVLAGRHAPLSARFAGAADMAERFGPEADWTRLETGAPVLADASVALDCRIASVSEVGSHSVFFAEVEDIRLHAEIEGLIYFNRAYHHLAAAEASA
ncbi:flavin reductase [Sphingomonas oleivorans]|uniref:Flavin reductase n=1 Tax=Sphingomonas oleivorans TaxID=1735121 RepID=A0A2T5G269_9SPHN|nr:flavin reductase [Sphingomonas oleivorans]PTQ13247.1 flavin reductase [Sphingomonas oleivorans]